MDTTALTEQTIKKILLARHLYALAEDNIRSGNPVRLTAGVILLQDSVEVFLLAIAEHLGASLDARMEFDKYFVEINKRIAPKELPSKTRLNSLNKLRVNAKHYAIQPAAEECSHFLASVSDFFDEVSETYMGQPFGSINLIDLLEKGETRGYLEKAVSSYAKGDFKDCLISCGKAIYVEFLFWYTIEAFKSTPPGSTPLYPLFMQWSLSPSYAQDAKYIDEKVNNPLDYIVIDHHGLDMELIKYGIRHNEFFNILRLTPQVYRSINDVWFVKEEFTKFADDIIKSSAEYVLGRAVNIVLRKQRELRRTKQPNARLYFFNLKSENVRIYEKADKNSKVVFLVPAGKRELRCDFRVTGLNNDDQYFHVFYMEDYTNSDREIYIQGYVRGEDISMND